MGNPVEPVGDAETTLGKLVELEIGTVGLGDTDSIGDKVGSALCTGCNVELPTVAVGIGGTLGC